MCREWLLRIYPRCNFYEPASSEVLEAVEDAFDFTLPDDLKQLLQETNGVTFTATYPKEEGEPYELGLLWSTEEMLRENQAIRSLCEPEGCNQGQAPLSSYFYFASTPNGDALAFQIT